LYLWGTPIQKGWGCWSEILKKNPRSYQDPGWWVWLEIFHPYEVPILKQNPISRHIFWALYPKRFHKISHCGAFEAEHLEMNQNSFLIPKRFDEYPHLFYMGVPLPWGFV